MIEPDVSDIGILEFYRGREAIAAGRKAVQKNLTAIRSLIETGTRPAGRPDDPAS
jgi:hypothetical protein